MDYIHVITDAQTGKVTEVPFTQAEIDALIEQNKKETVENNKAQAKQLLTDSDWSTRPSVADPTLSNPYLANQAEFIAYQNALRQIVFNPPDAEITFPIIPQEVWKTV